MHHTIPAAHSTRAQHRPRQVVRLRANLAAPLLPFVFSLACLPIDPDGASDQYTITLTADTPRVMPKGGRPLGHDVVTVRTNVTGGTAPYSYRWSVLNPAGLREDERLDALDVAAPMFRSCEATGTYVLTCVVTDARGLIYIDTLRLFVGQELDFHVAANRLWVTSGGGTNGQATITANPLGGIPPYSYTWSVVAPDGQADNARLAGSAPDVKTFTSASQRGTYAITCTLTDSVGVLAVDTVEVAVSDLLYLDVATERLSITPGGDSTGKTYLTANVDGGTPPYAYRWTITGPDGMEDDGRLDDLTISAPLFTSAALVGTYRATCTVTDAVGQKVADSMLIQVGRGLTMSVSTDQPRIVAGGGPNGTAKLSAAVAGGLEPYTCLWSVIDANGKSANGLLDDIQKAAPVFVSSNLAMTYRVTCTVTDAAGQIAMDSLEQSVGQPLSSDAYVTPHRPGGVGGGLDASSQWVASGGGLSGQAIITVEVIGGTPPYTYTWSAKGPDGNPANDRLSGAGHTTRTFTSSMTLGTYLVTCLIRDSLGVTLTDSVTITVYDQIWVDVTTDRQQMPAGGGATGTGHLAATVNGGTAPFTYVWTIVGPDNVEDNARLDDPTSPTPTFTSANLNGIYRATCLVTDFVGQQAEDSILFLVGQQVGVDLIASRQDVIAGGGQATLTANAYGGIAPYQYNWTVTNPSGTPENERLDDTTIASPTFTSDLTIGTYNMTCLVTDAFGFTTVRSVSLVVGGGLDQGLTVDVTATRASLPATGEQATLAGSANGGVAPITYAWTVIGPSGDVTAATLDNSAIAGPVFTAPATRGTYRISCTVTDSVLKTFTDSTHVFVGIPLSLDVRTDKMGIPAAGGTAALTASANGGASPYTYVWSALDPTGGNANAQLSNPVSATPTFTAPATAGTYRFTCTVTDSENATFTNSVDIYVGMALSLDVATTHTSLVSGRTATFSATATGGVSGYTYAWTVLDPSGADVTGATLDDASLAGPTFTAPATAGTYRCTCTVTDSVNATFTATLHVYVGMPLSLDVRTDKVSIPATGGTASLTATTTGGISGYTYAWSALDPSGGNANAQLSSLVSATPTFTAPATAGTYRLLCTVTDTASTTSTDSLEIYVGMPLSLDVRTDRISIPATGGTAGLTATATGGISGYTYAWSALDPSGGNANAQLSSLVSATPTFTAPATAGTYRVTCTVTDAANTTFTDSLEIYVGMPISLDVRTDRISIPATGGTAGLTATATGGISGYTYAWSALDPSGGNANAQLSSLVSATPTFTAPATAGTYRFTCMVTDAVNATFTDSLEIYVGMALSLDVRTNKLRLPTTGETALLNATASGGISGYTYAWTVLDPAGGNANAQLSSLVSATPTFTAPATAGTYRLTCTVTDAASATFTDSLEIAVGNGLSLEVTATNTSLVSGRTATFSAAAAGGISGYTYSWTVLDPSGANVTGATLDDAALPGPTFTAPATAGTYRCTCTVTDTTNETFTASCHIQVGMSLSLDVRANKTTIPATGGTASLAATATGGISGYTYAWSALDPSGGNANAQLSSLVSATPTFTAPATAGTYRLTCTVTDTANATFTDSCAIYVGMPLSLDVRTNKISIPATGGTASLTATATGGISGYTYAWSALDPSGGNANAQLSSLVSATPTFTAPATAGTYRLICTVTDTANATFTDSLTIYVGMPLSLDVRTDKVSIPATGGTASLTATATGGISGYTYAWSALDPSGGNANARLSSLVSVTPTFTAPATAGTYRLICTVTDTANATFTDSLAIYVGMPLSLDVRTDKISIPATGETASLTATATGGMSGYTYAWSALDPSGGNANAQLSSLVSATPTFTAPATAGTYRLICTVTDTANATFTDSLAIYVGMPLSLDVRASKISIPATGGTASLTAAATGGISGYTYAWSAIDPSGGNANAQLSSLVSATPTFTAPATAGTYRLSCTVTDTANATFTDSLEIHVGMSLSLDVTTAKSSLVSGQTTALTASAIGGIPGYTYAWTVLDPSGADVTGARLDDAALANPTFTAPATAGTYRCTCTATDTAGATFTTSLHINVGMPLSLDVRTNRQSIPATGGTATLAAFANGGISGYGYAWTVLDESDGDVTAATLNNSTVAGPVFTAPATAGTYRVSCTVTDAATATFSASLHLYVGMPLSLDVASTKQTMASNDTATLAAAARGGISPYTYSWSVLNPSNANVAATALDDITSASPTFTAPDTGGTYRATCTVTDAAGAQFAATLHVYVSTRSLTLTTPATADGDAAPTSILSSGFTSISAVLELYQTLPHARNLKIRLTDPDSSIWGTIWVIVEGAGAAGYPQTELCKFTAPGPAGKLWVGTMAFQRVDTVRYHRTTGGNPNANTNIKIGVGTLFGLPKTLSSESSVRQITLLPNTPLADCTIVTTPGHQGVDFSTSATPPDDTRSYEILYDDD